MWLLQTENDYYDREYSPNPNVFDIDKLYTQQFSSWMFGEMLPLVPADPEKLFEIESAFREAWFHYKKKCWGSDFYHPIVGRCSNSLNIGLTLVQSLTTLYIMGDRNNFDHAKDFIAGRKILEGGMTSFEFVVSVIGSLISAYELSGDRLLLDRAIEYSNFILPYINRTTGLVPNSFKVNDPIMFMDEGDYLHKNKQDDLGVFISKKFDVASYQMEFIKLAELTGNVSYLNAAFAGYDAIFTGDFFNMTLFPGHIAQRIKDPSFFYNHEHHNHGTDGMKSNKKRNSKKKKPKKVEETVPAVYPSLETLYECSPKSYFLTRGRIKRFLDDHEKNKHYLSGNMHPLGIDFNSTFYTSLIIGSYSQNDGDFQYAKDIMVNQCSLILAEPSNKFANMSNNLREHIEIIEPLFHLWRRSGDESIRNCTWSIFQKMRKNLRTNNGYISPLSGDGEPDFMIDITEPFLFGETFKYLYLIFSESNYLSPLDWTFNSEGQPFRMVKSTMMNIMEKEIMKIIIPSPDISSSMNSINDSNLIV